MRIPILYGIKTSIVFVGQDLHRLVSQSILFNVSAEVLISQFFTTLIIPILLDLWRTCSKVSHPFPDTSRMILPFESRYRPFSQKTVDSGPMIPSFRTAEDATILKNRTGVHTQTKRRDSFLIARFRVYNDSNRTRIAGECQYLCRFLMPRSMTVPVVSSTFDTLLLIPSRRRTEYIRQASRRHYTHSRQ